MSSQLNTGQVAELMTPTRILQELIRRHGTLLALHIVKELGWTQEERISRLLAVSKLRGNRRKDETN